MARVDLECRCGHKFFVGDAQVKAPGGVICPACLLPLNAPAGRLPSKAASRSPESSTAKLLAAVAQPVAAIPAPKRKLIVVGAVAAVLVVAVVVTLVSVLKTPSVDYDKQAQEAAEARKRKFEQYAQKEGKPEAPAVAAPPAKPAPAPSPERPTAFKALPPPASPASDPAPSPTPAKPAAPSTPEGALAEQSSVPLGADTVARLRSEVLELHPFYMNLVVTPAEKLRLNGLVASGRGTSEDASFIEALLGGAKLKAARDEVAHIAQT